MVPIKVYLAGPMTGLTYEQAAAWRKDVADELGDQGIDVYSPLRGKFYLERSSDPISDAYRKELLGMDKAIVSRDRWDVMRSDVVLVNLLNGDKMVSIGTMVELGWADAARKIIIVVMAPSTTAIHNTVVDGVPVVNYEVIVSRNIHDHAFVREIASYIVPTLDDAVDLILTLNKQGGAV